MIFILYILYSFSYLYSKKAIKLLPLCLRERFVYWVKRSEDNFLSFSEANQKPRSEGLLWKIEKSKQDRRWEIFLRQ